MKKLKAAVPVMACHFAKKNGEILTLLSLVLRSNSCLVFTAEGSRTKERGGGL